MMRRAVGNWLLVVLLGAGCAQVKPAEDFAFQTEAERLDAAAQLDDADAGDGVDAVSTDAADTADSADTTDAGDVDDAVDVPDAADTADTADTPDTADSADAADVGDAVDVPDAADVADVADAPDAADPCAGKNCDDGSPCTADTCKLGVCDHAAASGGACDTDKCNVDGVCVAGTCTATKKVSCDDGLGCTLDSCDAGSGCGHFALNNSAACADDPCMTGQTCVGGACQGGAATNCDDGDVCTDDTCAAPTGCAHVANTAPCDDGDACTAPDFCSGGQCAGASKFTDATVGGGGNDAVAQLLGVGGGFVWAGTTDSQGAGQQDFWLVHTDLAGKAIWETTYGGAQADQASDARALSDGYLVLGSTLSKGNGALDAWLIRTDLNGVVLWDQTYGSNLDDTGLGLTTDASGIAFVGTTTTAAGFTDAALRHVSLAGDATWSVTLGGTGEDSLSGIGALSDGYILAGHTSSSGAGGNDVWLVRTDLNGAVVWQKTYGTAGDDGANAVIALPNGYLAAGTTNGKGFGGSDAWLVRTDLNGVKLWDKTYGGKLYDDARRIIATPNGFAFSGTTASTGAGGNEMWLVRIDGFGNKVYGFPYGGTGDDGNANLVALTDGFALGGYAGSKGAGGTDAWLRRVDLFGNATCALSGACTGKLTSDCSDGNACTTDLCDAAHSGCWHGGADGMLCDDGLQCTATDVCTSKVCSGVVLNCDDANACTADSCDPEFGCVNESLNTGPCGGDACASAGVCANGTCVGALPINCDDGKACTDDSCAPATGCKNINNDANACSDGNACTVADHCAAGQCVGGTSACDDGNVCTDDSCNPTTGCVNANNNGACDDGNSCTTEACAGGKCGATALADGVTCATGGCAVGETCSAGVCGGGGAKLFTATFGTSTYNSFGGIASDADGFLLGGSKQNASAVGDSWLVRTDRTGKLIWENTYPVAFGLDDDIAGVGVTATGYAFGGDCASSSTERDLRIVTTDSAGKVVFDTHYAVADTQNGASFVPTADGGYALAGETYASVSKEHIYLLRTDSAGVQLWANSYGTAASQSAYAAVQKADGGFALAGQTFDGNQSDVMLLLTDKDGVQQTLKKFSAVGAEEAYAIANVPGGGFIIAGRAFGTSEQMFLQRVDSAGTQVWLRQLPASLSQSYASSVLALSDGYVVVGGAGEAKSVNNVARLVRADLLGTKLWERSYGGPEFDTFTRIVPLPDGFAIAGTTNSVVPSSNRAWLLRTDAFGNTDCGASGGCASQTLTSCDDTNPCTADICDAAGCKHPNLADGSPCGTNQTCVLGTCF